jgi:septum formation protein
MKPVETPDSFRPSPVTRHPSPVTQTAPLILASGSTIRQQMLKALGLKFSVVPSGVDEDSLKKELLGKPMADVALALARAKTLFVSAHHADAYTIGADQLCVLGDQVIDKPGSHSKAEAQLALLSGKTHQQHCAVVLARGAEIVWEQVGIANLTMRELSTPEIAAYVAADAPLAACGSYKFEALGRHLFSAVEGDHDVVKGLPLVPLLAQLHARGVISITA